MSSPRICHRCTTLLSSTLPSAKPTISSTSLSRPPRSSLRRQQSRTYQSPSHPPLAPYTPTETLILSTALSHVPAHGFTTTALRLGARDAGYLDASTHLFPRGVTDLVFYHYVTSRLGLEGRVQFPSEAGTGEEGAGAKAFPETSGRPLSEEEIVERIKVLIKSRLRMNRELGLVPHLPRAIALLTQAGTLPSSLKELGLLADEIVYLAGDVSVDGGWYTKRGAVMGVFAAAEVLQSNQAQEVEGKAEKELEAFVEERVDEVWGVGRRVGDFGVWAGFQARAGWNVLRSWGVRI